MVLQAGFSAAPAVNPNAAALIERDEQAN